MLLMSHIAALALSAFSAIFHPVNNEATCSVASQTWSTGLQCMQTS